APFDDGEHSGRPSAMLQQEILGSGGGDFYAWMVSTMMSCSRRLSGPLDSLCMLCLLVVLNAQGTGVRMKYTNIVPAQDWFYAHDRVGQDGPMIIYPVAVWVTYEKTLESGEVETSVMGLIAPDFGDESSNRLHTVPPLKGRYLHRNELTKEHLESLVRKDLK
ncbi:hypothetical protein ACEOIA_32495, partial [Pseudomonas aeruginosa]